MKVLVTGFDPFGGEKVNPAYEAVKLLPDTIAGARVVKVEIPTVFGKSGRKLAEAIEAESPDAVLCVGQAGGRAGMTVEYVAINLNEARIPDNEGKQPLAEAIQKDGETAYFATLPVKAMVKAMNEAGVPATLSYTAGTFVCNHLMYELLYLAAKRYPHLKGGFVHVPYATEQGVGKPLSTPTMSLHDMAKALEAGIEAIVHHPEDTPLQAGTTH